MALEVIGAGFGRTGTLSLKLALETLGFGPTYHMEEVFRHPSHVARWHEYAVDGRMDWDRLFRRYRSAVDFPASCAWRELVAEYPRAKVVLTVRDPRRWWASTDETIYWARDLFPRWLRRLVPLADRYLDMNERLVWDGLFGGRFRQRDHAIAVFERHTATVRAAVPDDRLLVFSVRDGWAPLCEFLGVAVPDRPFPHRNDAVSMRRKLWTVKVGARALPFVAAGAGAAVVGRRATTRARTRPRGRPGPD